MNDRVITEQEEMAYRLCHHDFDKLTTSEAAQRMGLTVRQVQRLLKNVKSKAPQLFPILTYRQTLVKSLIDKHGLTHKRIAEIFGCSEGNIDKIVNILEVKGVHFEQPKKTLSYENWMDSQVRRKY